MAEGTPQADLPDRLKELDAAAEASHSRHQSPRVKCRNSGRRGGTWGITSAGLDGKVIFDD